MPCACDSCTLQGRPFVLPRGPQPADVLIIGEAPGEIEAAKGTVFVGKSGQELSKCYLRGAGIPESYCRITNVALCHPPKNRVPTAREIECCHENLLDEIKMAHARVIVTLGKTATEALLGRSVDMGAVRGLVFDTAHGLVVPTYHPAYALRFTNYMSHIMNDFKVVKGVLSSDYTVTKPAPIPHVELIPDGRAFYPEGDIVAIDTEWAQGKPWCLSFCANTNHGYVVMADNRVALDALTHTVARKGTLTVLHNALYDLPVLEKMGVIPSKYTDTMVMAHLLQTEPIGLKSLAMRHLGIAMREYEEVVSGAANAKAVAYLEQILQQEWEDPEPIEKIVKNKWKVQYPKNIATRVERILADNRRKTCDCYARWNHIKLAEGREEVEETLGKMPQGELSDIKFEDAVQYSGTDAVATFGVWPILHKRVQEMGLETALEMDMATVPMIASMQERGIKLDVSRLEALGTQLRYDLMGIESMLESLAGKPVNPGSAKEVGQLLYEQGVFRDPTQSTQAKYLNAYRDNEIVANILKHRETKKLISTYVNSLPRHTDDSGRIHTRYSMVSTVTGRLASRNPNMQNVSAHTENGKEIRRAFVPEDGSVFLGMDFRQIELALTAHESNDPIMVKTLCEGGDLHSETSMKIFGNADKGNRFISKKVSFGILYGISGKGLSNQIGWSVEQCNSLIRDWFRIYKGVDRWVKLTQAKAKKELLVRDLYGRMRLIPEVKSCHDRIRAEGLRYCTNAPIQTGAGSILKKAISDLIPVYKGMQNSGLNVHPLLQLHDELIWEVEESLAEYAASIFSSVMENCVTLRVPLKVEYTIADNWRDCK